MTTPNAEPTPESEIPAGLVKVSVNLLPVAWKAIETAAEREGISRTDAINRALQAYETLTGLDKGALLGYDIDRMTLVVVLR
jgi:hypothetical protein